MFDLFPAKQFFRVNPTGVRLRRTLAMAVVLPLLLFGIREPRSQARTLQVKERSLVYGAPIEQALEGRQVHTYQLDLNEGQYVRIIVEQRGVDVVVALRNADGALVYEVDSPNGTAGTEEIPYVVKRSGRYLVTVASFDEKAPAGKYEARLSELRSATEQDEYLSAGERAEAEADRLNRRRDATLLRQAQGKYEDAARAWRSAGKPGKEAGAIYGIALVHQLLGEPEKALEFLERALPLYREAQDTAGMAKIYGALGVSWSGRGEHQKALSYMYEARSLLKDTGNLIILAPILSSIGAILSMLGETQKAFQTYEETLDLLRTGIATTKDEAIRNALRSDEAQVLGNVCVARNKTGEWQQALDACNQA
ncbi:MAG: tetratricopeptide repeat protein, partial [Blastocatellia bacterium]